MSTPVAVITGAASGIGLEVARRLARTLCCALGGRMAGLDTGHRARWGRNRLPSR
ncbi:hypothetical protein [Nocardia terpenica]|uniref:Uncharacterized protein n=1 Tax=Nocardia terpenica TaxID=455432 RepID=A0A6G9Z028_9NOCA|nr:hypothetical protein [Nocardia terpenica]QIS18935.1 hypothetical protein F6W96_12135 [Nocardia terpenica]